MDDARDGSWPLDDEEAPVEGALRAAFVPEDEPGGVLTEIARLTKVTTAVHLREEDLGAPDLLPGRGWTVARRYTVADELGRGGVGVVLRGRDCDLGRQVALKFLRPDRLQNRLLVRRFLQEAQIEGQLQHPGIVPVYDLGITADGRPFFAMKLVRGRTLRALLAERASPDSERRRFLRVFEQIAQTVAYAHSRGVVHRDLKPDNVMIGSFGEVQVVDWGLAKVLGGPAEGADPTPDPEEGEQAAEATGAGEHTRAGSVLGTPPYMPPEQAGRGDVCVDQRADVFSLGAILLEILTGAPAYRRGGAEGLLQAMHADLGDAYARLDACVADPDLVALCRACLAPRPEDRPADAGALAERLGAHLSAVEERTRRAEVSAAEARARAASERRARRLTLALAGAVFLTLGLGGAGWLWVSTERRAREERASRGARQALAEGRERLGEARRAGPDDLAPWDAAMARATLAADLAREGAPAEDVAAAEALVAMVATERTAAAARREERLRDRAMTARLDAIRAARGESADLRGTESAYARAFEDHGLRIPGDDGAPSAIRASPIAGPVIAALDEWAWIRARLAGPDDPLRRRLLAIADAADGDPVRAMLRRDPVRPGGGAPEAQHSGGLSPDAALFLGRHLALAGKSQQAAAILRDAWRARPQDAWTSFELAEALTLPPSPSWDEAAGYYRASLAAQPGNRAMRARLASALRRGGHLDEAIATWRQTLAEDPGDVEAYRQLLTLHAERGDLAATLEELETASRAFPDDPRPFLGLGLAHRLRGEYAEAARNLEHAVALAPGDPWLRTHLAESLLWSGRPDDAESTVRQVLVHDERFSPAWEMLHRVLVHQGRFPEALAAVRQASTLDPESALYQFGLATALLFDKQLDEALVVSDRFVSLAPFEPLAHAVRGGVHLARGDLEGAVASCERAVALVQGGLEAAPWGLTQIGEYDRASRTYRWRTVPGWDPHLGPDRIRLATALVRLGEPDRALRALDALPWRPEMEKAADWVRQRILMSEGRLSEALPILERLIPDPLAGGEMRVHYGVCLLAAGRVPEARVWLLAMREVVRWTPGWLYPEEEWIRDVDGFVALASVLRSPEPPNLEGMPAEEALRLGYLLLTGGRPFGATAAFEAAFAAAPALEARLSYWPTPFPGAAGAAMAALQAAAGWGADARGVSDEERVRLRARARAWLDRAIQALEDAVGSAPEGRATWLLEMGEELLTQDAFASVRDEANLRRLPPEEVGAWRTFWADVRRRAPPSASGGR